MTSNYTTNDEKNRLNVIHLAARCFPLNRDKSPKVNHWQGHINGKNRARLFGIPVPEGVVIIDHDSYAPDAISKEELAKNLGITPRH